MALLSTPLPETCPLPANAQSFFLQLVQEACKSPSSTTLRPVYRLLEGACREFLDILPASTLNSLAESIFKILRNIKNVEGEPLYLLCLGIIRSLSAPRTPSISPTSVGTSSETNSPEWRIRAARSYFVGPKASNTLQLVALQVMWACRDNDQSQLTDSFECLDIAISIAESIQRATRFEWSKSKAVIVRKMAEKILRTDIDAGLQLRGLAFMGFLVEDIHMLPKQTIAVWEGLLLQHALFGGHVSEKLFSPALYLYGGTIGTVTALKLLRQALRISSCQEQTTLQSVKQLTTLLRALSSFSASSTSIRTTILTVLGDSQFLPVLNQFFEFAGLPIKHNGSSCHAAYFNETCRLGEAVISIILHAVLLEPSSSCLSQGSIVRLLRKQEQLSRIQASCDCSPMPMKRSIVLQDPANQISWSSHNWKSQLQQHLGEQGEYVHGVVVKLMSDVCGDFEQRCANVEQPLREEQARFKGLELRYRELEGLLDESNSQVKAQSANLEREQHQKEALQADLETSESRGEALRHQISKLEQSLQQSKAALGNLRDEQQDASLRHRAEIAIKDDVMDDLRMEISQKEEALQDSRERCCELEKKFEACDNERTSLVQSLQESEAMLATYQTDKSKLDSELSIATRRLDERSSEIERLKTIVENKAAQCEEWRCNYDACVSEFESKAAATTESHATEISELQNKVGSLRA